MNNVLTHTMELTAVRKAYSMCVHVCVRAMCASLGVCARAYMHTPALFLNVCVHAHMYQHVTMTVSCVTLAKEIGSGSA